ncbi:flagellar biosynthetic protein FliO [Muricoccus radiodurans]|uniref:flagellar biosynthetic protein FliO n=1 Tax=Muricoccus radiodurans TaxID=2231721 RepID=UPI003CEA704F
MTPGATDWITAAGALAAVLLLLWAATRLAARRLGQAPGPRRARLVEATPLDSRRRLVILRVDDREAVLLTGGPNDLFLGWL